MARKEKTKGRLGFLRTDKDISYFITYVMTLLPGPITLPDLLDICLIEEAFGYFEFQQQLERLVDIGVIYRDDNHKDPLYFATQKCTDNGEEVKNALPMSARDKAQAAVARVLTKIRRNASIQKDCVANEDGTYNATVAIVDGDKILMKVELMLINRRNVDMVFDNFQRHAESYYKNFINDLMEFTEDQQ